MKRRELERRLQAVGWMVSRHGGEHDVWVRGEREIVVPCHAEIIEYTAKAILKEAGGKE